MDTINITKTIAPDSLASSDTLASAYQLIRVSDASEIFGRLSFMPQSESIAIDPTYAQLVSLSDSLVYKFVVIALMFYYAFLLLNSGSHLDKLYKLIKSKDYLQDFSDTSANNFSSFLHKLKFMFCVGSGIILLKILSLYLLPNFSFPLNESYNYLLILPFIFILPLIFLAQKIVLRIGGWLTLSKDFINQLLLVKDIIISGCSIIVMPLILLIALYEGFLVMGLLYFIGIIVLFWLILLLYKTYMLFISQNISFLHWFLYLCAVEIFPYTILIIFLDKPQ